MLELNQSMKNKEPNWGDSPIPVTAFDKEQATIFASDILETDKLDFPCQAGRMLQRMVLFASVGAGNWHKLVAFGQL